MPWHAKRRRPAEGIVTQVLLEAGSIWREKFWKLLLLRARGSKHGCDLIAYLYATLNAILNEMYM